MCLILFFSQPTILLYTINNVFHNFKLNGPILFSMRGVSIVKNGEFKVKKNVPNVRIPGRHDCLSQLVHETGKLIKTVITTREITTILWLLPVFPIPGIFFIPPLFSIAIIRNCLHSCHYLFSFPLFLSLFSYIL